MNKIKYPNTNISVMIPVYNGEETLSHCLDSVIDQTISDYELLLLIIIQQTTLET